MKLSHIQEARHHKEHPMIDKIKQAAKNRTYYETSLTDVDIEEVKSMLTRHFGEPALVRDKRTFWDMGNDELVVIDNYPFSVKVYVA